MAQGSSGGRDWFAFWVAQFLRAVAVVVPVAAVLLGAGDATFFITALTWSLVALLLGIRPQWDESYRHDRPLWQSSLIYLEWFVGVVVAVCLTVLDVVVLGITIYLLPALPLAILVFAVARVVVRSSVERV